MLLLMNLFIPRMRFEILYSLHGQIQKSILQLL